MTDPRTDTTPEEVEADVADDYMDDGEFNLDRYHAETRRDPYHFRWAGGSWELPHVYDLDIGILDLIERDPLQVADIVHALKTAFGPVQWEKLSTNPLPIMAMTELFGRWMVHCGVDVGEAKSSAASSGDTAGRSKRTSTGSTASASARRSTGAKKTATRRVRSSR